MSKIILTLFILNFCMVGVVGAKIHYSHIEYEGKDIWKGEIESKEIDFWNGLKRFFKVRIKLEKKKSEIDGMVWLLCVFRF